MRHLAVVRPGSVDQFVGAGLHKLVLKIRLVPQDCVGVENRVELRRNGTDLLDVGGSGLGRRSTAATPAAASHARPGGQRDGGAAPALDATQRPTRFQTLQFPSGRQYPVPFHLQVQVVFNGDGDGIRRRQIKVPGANHGMQAR